jgi:hypothetical protein
MLHDGQVSWWRPRQAQYRVHVDQLADEAGYVAVPVQHLTECDDMRQGCALRCGSG